MSEQAEVEIVIGSRDDAVVSDIEARLANVEPERWRDARFVDPVTILAIGTGVAKLIDALLGLKRDLAAKPDAPRVEVKTPDGRSVVLTDATPEMLTALLSSTQSS